MIKRSIKSSGLAAPMAMSRQGSGFTIVEILVCLAIVCLLATIAIPNFLRAHTAADVAAARVDLQKLKTGLEAYKSDRGAYPWQQSSTACRKLFFSGPSIPTLDRLSTPIMYLEANCNFVNRFNAIAQYEGPEFETTRSLSSEILRDYRYNARNQQDTSTWGQVGPQDVDPIWYFLEASGPDQHFHWTWNALNRAPDDNSTSRAILLQTVYDPTNGTVSRGSIWVQGGNPQGYGTSMAWAINQQSSSHVGEWRKY